MWSREEGGVGDNAVEIDSCLQTLVAGTRNLKSSELQTDERGRSAGGEDIKYIKEFVAR
jgi:hypothetical protein